MAVDTEAIKKLLGATSEPKKTLENTQLTNIELIVRQVAVKAAVDFFADRKEAGRADIRDLAAELEKWIWRERT